MIAISAFVIRVAVKRIIGDNICVLVSLCIQRSIPCQNTMVAVCRKIPHIVVKTDAAEVFQRIKSPVTDQAAVGGGVIGSG